MSEAVSTRRSGRLRLLVCSAHPKQAVFFAAVIAVLAAIDGRAGREVAVTAAAVLVVQLSLGLDNDLADAQHDYRAQTAGKPIASGALPAETASYAMYVLILLAIPLAAFNGGAAATALWATLPLGWVHNHWLHRTGFSFLAWTATFALAPAYLSYGGWGGQFLGDPPTWAVTGAAAAVGFCWHLATSLGDLVTDNKAGARNLPLRLALRLGAPRLLVLTIFLGTLALAGLVGAVLGLGLHQ